MGKPKKKRPGQKNLKRVEFRQNREKPSRPKDWTRLHREDDADTLDASSSERVVAKGDLSRKRTVVDGSTQGAEDAQCRDGTIVTIYGAIADVDDGVRVWPCTIRRVLRTRSIGERNAVTVGDRVRFLPPSDREGVEEEGVIVSVAERKSVLKRVTGRRAHTVAANVDQVIIVASAYAPTPKPHLVDRYIVAALAGNMSPVICLNKIDLAEDDEVRSFLAIYQSLGYTTIGTSATTGAGLEKFRKLLLGKSSVLAGQSGVGKSSLLNAVDPTLDLEIGLVVEDTRKGRHTTTRSRLIKLDRDALSGGDSDGSCSDVGDADGVDSAGCVSGSGCDSESAIPGGGAYVVDTPGVKSFDLGCVPRAEIEQYFVEFVERLQHCKFADCTHTHEIECSIIEAVENGEIDPGRYESYVRLFEDVDLRPPSHPPRV